MDTELKCEICGKVETYRDTNHIVFTHYGVFCMRCLAMHEWKFKKLTKNVCKAEVEIIKEELKNDN